MAQAREVAGLLSALGVSTELIPMVTEGDRGAFATASPQGVNPAKRRHCSSVTWTAP